MNRMSAEVGWGRRWLAGFLGRGKGPERAQGGRATAGIH